MDSHIFRKGRWVIDLNDNDANGHCLSAGFSQDTLLITKYFVHLLYVDSETLGVNEYAERHAEIKDAILDVMQKKLNAAARAISAVIEGILKRSLEADKCISNTKPHPTWTGSFHDNTSPKNFHQLLEGALQDPRSRIGSTIDYPPSEEIFHVSEMIRNPMAHGAVFSGTLEDYKVLFFILILLYHDLVNPHGYQGNHKYLKWVERTRVNLRLQGIDPTNEEIQKRATAAGLDLSKLEKNMRVE